MKTDGPYINPTVSQAEGGPGRAPYRRVEQVMYPVPDHVLLPCHWLREEISEDRMEFRRDDDRFAISAVRRGECPPLPGPCPGRGWELRYRQRAGEAASVTTFGYVTTRAIALDTVVRYMERINEAIEGEVDLTPSAVVDLLGEEDAIGDHGWKRTSMERTIEEFSL